MSFGLGFWAAAGASSAAAGAYELISTAFGTGSSGVVTFSSIPQTYKHLQIRTVTKNNGSSSETGKQIRVTYNGVTTASHASHALRGSGTSVIANETWTNLAYILTAFGNAGSTNANVFGTCIFDLLDYADSNKNKTLRTFNGHHDTAMYVGIQSGFFPATTAITSLTLTAGNGTYDAASRFSLYGIRG
jgi:hypothetical protein